jgi:hypothetical protein
VSKSQTLGLSVSFLVLASIAAWLLLPSTGPTPTVVFTNCAIVGNPTKDIKLHANSSTQDRAVFSSTDDRYQILFSSVSPFQVPVDFDKNTPETPVITNTARNQCNWCLPHVWDCSSCYFSFVARDISDPSKNDPHTGNCPDPGVHITR